MYYGLLRRKNMRKKVYLLLTLLSATVLLSACGGQGDITADSEGFWDSYFVYPLSWVITNVADLFDGSYGWTIIIVTLLFRLLLVPLNVKQLKRSEEHTSELQ